MGAQPGSALVRHRALVVGAILVGPLAFSGCAQPGTAGNENAALHSGPGDQPEALRTVAQRGVAATAGMGLDDAAAWAEDAFGTPRDLLVAIADVETRLSRSPSGGAGAIPFEAGAPPDHDLGDHDGADLVPRTYGIGGLRSWCGQVDQAGNLLGVPAERIDADPALGTIALAAVLRAAAAQKDGGAPAADPSTVGLAGWADAVGHFSCIADPEARRLYVSDVFGRLRRGLDTTGPDGETIRISPRPVAEAALVARQRAYDGAEVPFAHWAAADPSNHSVGRGGEPIDTIIIHTVQGSYAGAISWFQNPTSNVSTHFVVRSVDGDITQMLAGADAGWHAGNPLYNQRSIGIEHEGYITESDRWYTDAMYESSAQLVRFLCDRYGIPQDREHIIGHAEVPHPTIPGRFGGTSGHTDPGAGWDWDHFLSLVRGPGLPRDEFNAAVVAVEAPTAMISGETAVAVLEIENRGSAAWDPADTYLTTTRPRDHGSPFHDLTSWPSAHQPPTWSAPVSGGESVRVEVPIVAPAVTDVTHITDTFGLVHDLDGRVLRFGPGNIEIGITVAPRPTTAPVPIDGVGGVGDLCVVSPGACDGLGSASPPEEDRGDGGWADGVVAPRMAGDGCSIARPGMTHVGMLGDLEGRHPSGTPTGSTPWGSASLCLLTVAAARIRGRTARR